MRKKKIPSPAEEQRPKRRADDEGRQGAGPERPPESAEDFGHVLRRLIAARGPGRRSERQP
jgi:hypothetical protein